MSATTRDRTPPRARPRSPGGLLAACVALAGLALGLLPASVASAEPDPEDYARALEGWLESLPKDRTDMLRCPELAGGTAGMPERPWFPPREPVTGHGRTDTDAPDTLPDQVHLRRTDQTYNRRYQFALTDGTIWFKANAEVTGIDEPWTRLDVPDCFDGRVAGIAADDDELIAIDEDRWIYTLDGILSAPTFFSWTMRWGPPVWTGSGHRVPEGIRDWDWSVISLIEDGSFRDDAGNDHAIGEGKVSHIWVLGDDERRLTYIDPWLPRDESYELCAPHRDRFRAEALSASGSTVFVVGPRGDLFTRLYDFDIAGEDPFFFSYSYEDQSGERNPDIQLPSPDWIQHPKIPGTITDRISIHKVGELALHRTMRVEGRQAGRTGYWHKDITEDAWRFQVTDEPLQGTVLRNPRTDTSARDLGPSEDRRYAGPADEAHLVVEDFHVACTPARLLVQFDDGEELALVLHSVDGLRQHERARGLDDDPRWIQGTIEIPPEVRERAGAAGQAFLAGLGGGRFVGANLDATADALAFRDQGWELSYDGPTTAPAHAVGPSGSSPDETDAVGGPAGDRSRDDEEVARTGAAAPLPVTGGAATGLALSALVGAAALRRRTPGS